MGHFSPHRASNFAVAAGFVVAVSWFTGSAPAVLHVARAGDCGYPDVDIDTNDPTERSAACAALAEVTTYFRNSGFDLVPKASLYFADRSAAATPEHGHYDAVRSRIVVYRTSAARPWGLTWTSALANSFLRHELAHVLIRQATDAGRIHLRPEWHEFIAYAIQFDLMEPQLRQAVLAAHADVQPFESWQEVNEFTSRMNPDVFSVAAYKTYLDKGGRDLVGRLVSGDWVPPRFTYPFYTLPGQLPNR